MFHVPEKYRITEGPLASSSKDGNNGAFKIPFQSYLIFCVASDQLGWEHVSVSLNKPITPTWEIMCHVKDLFWDEEDTVIQFHPPKSLYVNNHPHCLHLWRPINSRITLPHPLLVGLFYNEPPLYQLIPTETIAISAINYVKLNLKRRKLTKWEESILDKAIEMIKNPQSFDWRNIK